MTEPHTHFLEPSRDPRHWESYVPGTMQRLSPLYQQYAHGMTDDAPMQALLSLVDTDQPLPITFFSAVNFLLLRDQTHPLADFYPSLREQPRSAEAVYPFFRNFCLTHEEELRALLPTMRLQTNEVTRCANLLPAFHLIFRRGGHVPLVLIELGASAGLNLLWDSYGYTYQTETEQAYWVNASSAPVQLHCTLQGPHVPLFLTQIPPIARRVGIDLHPLDITSEQDVRWLRACIWPEETHRYTLLDAAIAQAKQHPPELVAGDAADLLPAMLEGLPWDQTVCLWHSYALRQGPVAVRERIQQVLIEQSLRRTIYRVSLEMEPGEWEAPRLELFTYHQGRCVSYDWLATCDVHGSQMCWRSPLGF